MTTFSFCIRRSVLRSAVRGVALAALASCGAATGSAKAPAPAANAPAATAPAESAAEAGYREVMASQTLDGAPLAKEARPTALVFFASWCGHCQHELEILGNLREQYPELRIIGLNAYEEFRDFSDEERLRAYVAQSAPWLTEIVTAGEAMRGVFGGIPKIPSLFLYDASGAVQREFRRTGGPPPSKEVLEAAVRDLMAGAQGAPSSEAQALP